MEEQTEEQTEEQPEEKAQETFTVQADEAGQRLDRWLTAALPDRSRNEVQRWIKEGAVTVDGDAAKASLKVEPGQQIGVVIPQVEASRAQAQDIPLVIIYEDDDLLVIDKPAGMVVHPAPGHADGTLVNAILHHCPDIRGVGGERRPGLVHRLDKETSGLIVVAKHDAAHRTLQAQFKARTVHKEYLALVEGHLDPPQGRINAPIGRHPVHRKQQTVLPDDPVTGEPAGRSAVTDYTVLGYYTGQTGSGSANFSLIRAVLHTGRTHQIRVHMAWFKHPIVGDTLYGFRRQRIALSRHFLHAHTLRIRLPSSGEERTFTAPLPVKLQRILDRLEM